MSPEHERDDARLIERVREAWSPAPPTPARRAAFDAGLQERLERVRRRRGLWPAFGAGLVAASLATLLVVRSETTPPPAPGPVAMTASTADETALYAADLLYSSTEDVGELESDDAGLPTEYAAIAGVFLDR
jgi:hypothetical protein